jgi:hypothetical protein
LARIEVGNTTLTLQDSRDFLRSFFPDCPEAELMLMEAVFEKGPSGTFITPIFSKRKVRESYFKLGQPIPDSSFDGEISEKSEDDQTDFYFSEKCQQINPF